MNIYNKRQKLLIFTLLALALPSFAQNSSWMVTPANPQEKQTQNTNTAFNQAFSVPAGNAGIVYSQLASQNLWVGSARNESRLRSFINFLPAIEDHGLKINDYNFNALLSTASQNPQNFDLLFTNEVLRLLKDVRVGRVNPKSVSNDVKFVQRAFNVDSKVIGFFNSPSEFSFAAVAPQHKLYFDLADALQNLRQINSRGGFRGVRPTSSSLKLGSNNPVIYEMKSILNVFGFNLNLDNNFDSQFETTLKKVQEANLAIADGILSPDDQDAWQYFTVDSFTRQQEVELMMEKIRWLPEYLGERYIFLNIASQELAVIDPNLNDSSPIKLQKAIAGRTDRKTPTMADKVTHVVINPTWTVPPGIMAKDKLPALKASYNSGGLAGLQSYLTRLRFSLLDRVSGQPIDPASVDWVNVTAQDVPFKLVQSTGLDNALGVVKFTLTNPYNIYLHDTNERGLFKFFQRLRSSGCVRIHHPIEFAAYLLQGSDWSIDKLEAAVATPGQVGVPQKWVKIAPQMSLPVYMMPMTAYKKGEQFYFTQDKYKQNTSLLRALKKAGYYSDSDLRNNLN